jgi:hypothetical protein
MRGAIGKGVPEYLEHKFGVIKRKRKDKLWRSMESRGMMLG